MYNILKKLILNLNGCAGLGNETKENCDMFYNNGVKPDKSSDAVENAKRCYSLATCYDDCESITDDESFSACMQKCAENSTQEAIWLANALDQCLFVATEENGGPCDPTDFQCYSERCTYEYEQCGATTQPDNSGTKPDNSGTKPDNSGDDAAIGCRDLYNCIAQNCQSLTDPTDLQDCQFTCYNKTTSEPIKRFENLIKCQQRVLNAPCNETDTQCFITECRDEYSQCGAFG